MFSWFKKQKTSPTTTILAVTTGTVVSLKQVPDPVFSQRMMGDGVAIKPDFTTDLIVAPLSGQITLNDGHAFALTTAEGIEVLVHVGINTVALEGTPFQNLAIVGQKVAAGEPCIKVNWQMIQENRYNPLTMIVFPDDTLNQMQLNFAAGTCRIGKKMGQVALNHV